MTALSIATDGILGGPLAIACLGMLANEAYAPAQQDIFGELSSGWWPTHRLVPERQRRRAVVRVPLQQLTLSTPGATASVGIAAAIAIAEQRTIIASARAAVVASAHVPCAVPSIILDNLEAHCSVGASWPIQVATEAQVIEVKSPTVSIAACAAAIRVGCAVVVEPLAISYEATANIAVTTGCAAIVDLEIRRVEIQGPRASATGVVGPVRIDRAPPATPVDRTRRSTEVLPRTNRQILVAKLRPIVHTPRSTISVARVRPAQCRVQKIARVARRSVQRQRPRRRS